MEVKVFLESRKTGTCVEAVYTGDSIIVLPGGKVSKDFASHIHGGRTAKKYRGNDEYVNDEGVIIKECRFLSPSTAAQFVTGYNCNGYRSWKVDANKSLGGYLNEKGLR